MPDVHLGKGATIGSVIPTREAIIPADVGVDMGCGMNAVGLSLKASRLPDNTGILRGVIWGTCSYIVIGKGNEVSLSSCAHGAGRRMGCRQTKKRYNCHDLER